MSTSNYQIYGNMATQNGFRAGSSEWWAELRRLRAINNAPLTAEGGVQICNDSLQEIRAGMFVTAQLGNKTDSDWSPCAPCLLLFTNVAFFGDTQYTGLYKRANGKHYIMQFVTKATQGQRLDPENDQAEDNDKMGVVYCTSSLPYDMDKKNCEYLSDRENHLIAEALNIHRDKVAKLPVAYRFKDNIKID